MELSHLDIFVVSAADHELVGCRDAPDAAAVGVVREGGELSTSKKEAFITSFSKAQSFRPNLA
jgi:hypothetical protein